MRHLRRTGRAACPDEDAHLFIRCFHGENTWVRAHFLGKLRRSFRGKLQYLWAARVVGDVRAHPAFRLNPIEQQSADDYLALSRELGLLAH